MPLDKLWISSYKFAEMSTHIKVELEPDDAERSFLGQLNSVNTNTVCISQIPISFVH